MTTVPESKSIQALRRASAEKRLARISKEARLRAEGMKEVGRLSRRDYFIAGLALYWGEGYKSLGQEVGFTNSDPAMILFFIRWLSKCYGITQDRLILRVSINILHIHRVKEVERYWSRLAGIPLSQFTKISLIKSISKKRYANESVHYGTLRVKVRRGTDLRRKILGSVEKCKQSATL